MQHSERNEVRVFLISPPWAMPLRPSIQTATLKSYLDHQFGDTVEIRTVSAHLGIPVYADGAKFNRFYERWSKAYEWAYMLAYQKRFGLPGLNNVADDPDTKLAEFGFDIHLDDLIEATIQFLDDHLVPHLSASGINILGFTCNFDQVYASLFLQAYLVRICGSRNVVTLLGGMSAVSPRTTSVLQQLSCDAYCVVGEGESRLAEIVETCVHACRESDASTDILDTRNLRPILSEIGGVFHVSTPPDLINFDRATLSNQRADISSFPLPDYSEYFSLLRELSGNLEVYNRVKKYVAVMVEGSRGCFAKCDFCSLNYLWDGFRKLDGETVADRVRNVSATYGTKRVFFTDNVCDTWAQSYAEDIRERGPELESFMELRAHHDQNFFTAMKMAGVDIIQIGVEALAPNLMRAMRKGTTVVQNLRAQKYIGELGITSAANIITHHPKSTLADVSDTRRILQTISHYPEFNMSPFALCVGSPIYLGLNDEQKRQAVADPFARIEAGSYQSHLIDWWFHLPDEERANDDIQEAWNSLKSWYARSTKEAANSSRRLIGYALSNGTVQIRDSRSEVAAAFVLCDSAARLHEAAHSGLHKDRLSEVIPDMVECSDALQELIERKLILNVEDHIITVTFRPIVRLYREFFATRGLDSNGESKPPIQHISSLPR